VLYPLRKSDRDLLFWLVQLCFVAAFAGGLGIDARVLKKVEEVYGGEARTRVENWDGLVRNNAGLPVEEKLETVNRFFNEMKFTTDQEHWGRKDYWATPIEFLGTNGGDCEDFSVAKYFTLRELGVPMDKLRLTYVKALKLNQSHMVLTYYETPGSEPVVLDNLVPDIRPASRRKDLVPVYSFNGDGLWLAKERGKGQKVGGSDRISHWKELKRRMLEFEAQATPEGTQTGEGT